MLIHEIYELFRQNGLFLLFRIFQNSSKKSFITLTAVLTLLSYFEKGSKAGHWIISVTGLGKNVFGIIKVLCSIFQKITSFGMFILLGICRYTVVNLPNIEQIIKPSGHTVLAMFSIRKWLFKMGLLLTYIVDKTQA